LLDATLTSKAQSYAGSEVTISAMPVNQVNG
jgi:hypothetical protein